MTPKKSNPKKIVTLVAALNAAVWLGGAVFFTFIAGPAFFSPALDPILPKPEDGIAARYLIGKFTTFQIACASIALGTMVIGWRWYCASQSSPDISLRVRCTFAARE